MLSKAAIIHVWQFRVFTLKGCLPWLEAPVLCPAYRLSAVPRCHARPEVRPAQAQQHSLSFPYLLGALKVVHGQQQLRVSSWAGAG